jgi:hypothetical protein
VWFADEIRRAYLICVLGGRNRRRRGIVLDWLSPSFREKERRQTVAERVLAAGMELIESNAIHFIKWWPL